MVIVKEVSTGKRDEMRKQKKVERFKCFKRSMEMQAEKLLKLRNEEEKIATGTKSEVMEVCLRLFTGEIQVMLVDTTIMDDVTNVWHEQVCAKITSAYYINYVTFVWPYWYLMDDRHTGTVKLKCQT
jgi:hypothetical protein